MHDTCLWTSLAAATGAPGNSTALVGTPEMVAKAMFEYYKLGAMSLLIRGYDPRPDAIQYGEELIPRLGDLVAGYDTASARSPERTDPCEDDDHDDQGRWKNDGANLWEGRLHRRA